MSKGSRAASRRGKEDFEILVGAAGPARMSRRAVSRVTSTVQVDIAGWWCWGIEKWSAEGGREMRLIKHLHTRGNGNLVKQLQINL
jgi:hypothetical protein